MYHIMEYNPLGHFIFWKLNIKAINMTNTNYFSVHYLDIFSKLLYNIDSSDQPQLGNLTYGICPVGWGCRIH